MLLIPHSCAIEMDHKPFAGIESDRVGELHSLKPTAKFGAYERAACVCRINMQP